MKSFNFSNSIIARVIRGGIFVALLLSTPISYGAADAIEITNKLNSALIYKLTKFVRWPVINASDSSYFHLCLLNNGEIPIEFKTLEDYQVQNLPIKVRSFKRSDMIDDNCHIVFIDRLKGPFIKDILANLAQRPILTVSNLIHFSETGGMLEIGTRNGKINFQINLNSVNAAKLKISAALLQLSTVVKSQEVR